MGSDHRRRNGSHARRAALGALVYCGTDVASGPPVILFRAETH